MEWKRGRTQFSNFFGNGIINYYRNGYFDSTLKKENWLFEVKSCLCDRSQKPQYPVVQLFPCRDKENKQKATNSVYTHFGSLRTRGSFLELNSWRHTKRGERWRQLVSILFCLVLFTWRATAMAIWRPSSARSRSSGGRVRLRTWWRSTSLVADLPMLPEWPEEDLRSLWWWWWGWFPDDGIITMLPPPAMVRWWPETVGSDPDDWWPDSGLAGADLRCLPKQNIEPRPFKRSPAALAFFFLLLGVSFLLFNIGIPISDGDRGGGIISFTSTSKASSTEWCERKEIEKWEKLIRNKCENHEIFLSPLALCWFRQWVGLIRRNCDRQPLENFRCSRDLEPPGWPSVGDSRNNRFEAPPPASGSLERPSAATPNWKISSNPKSVQCPSNRFLAAPPDARKAVGYSPAFYLFTPMKSTTTWVIIRMGKL